MKNATLLHVFAAVSILLAFFQDSTPTDEPEPPPTGDLVISLTGSDGASLGGACFDILHAEGVSSVCDDDGDGSAQAYDLPAGDVTVRQSSGVAGYNTAPEGYGYVPDGDTGYVTLTAQVIPPTPTPEPTVEPTAVPTEEPAPTDVPTEVPTEEPAATEEPDGTAESQDDTVIVPFAAGDITIDCNHTTGSTTSDFSIAVDDFEGDVPFSITVTPYDLTGNPLEPITFTESPVELPDEEWRRIEVDVQFSNGQTGSAVAGCNVDPLDTSITTTPLDANGDPIPDGGDIEPGTSMSDTAELDGQSIDAGGTVTYYLYDTADCSGDPVFTSGPKAVVNGVVPDSDSYTPNESGTYQWVVVYSGDVEDGDPTSNSNFNAPAESGCGDETVIVGEVETTLTTGMRTADGDPIPQSGSIPLGTDVYDTADLNGATDDASGTVTYSLYSGACPGTLVAGPYEVDVTNGQIPDSPVVSDLPQGTYNWVVEYSGDDTNTPASSACGAETFTVEKAQPDVATTMFNSDGTVISDGAEVPVDTSMYDSAQITDNAEPLTGTVTYALYDSGDCTGTPVAGPFVVDIGEDGTIPASPDVVLDTVGTFNWVVTYSGDENNEAASSDCGLETVNVEPASPTITTEIFNAADDSVIDPGSVVPDDSTVYDTADLDGQTDDATGTVTFSLYNNFTCAGTPYFTVTVPLNPDGSIPPTPDVGPLPGGTWNWTASYSGDDKNNPASTTCGDEEFFIGQGQGGVSTMVEDTNGVDKPDGSTVTVDTILRDTAVLDGVTPDASGTVTFYLFQGQGQDCTPLSDAIFTSAPVPVVNGVVQGPSGTFTFVTQGTYEWVAVYSGDVNNASVTSACGAETIIVVGRPSSVTTAMFTAAGAPVADNARVLTGTPVYDTATVTPADATGTLTYRLYANANCSGTPAQTFANIPIGSPSPQVTLTTPGVYNWRVQYSGDARYATSQNACGTETFFIALQPTVVTIMVDENGVEIPNNSELQAGDYIGDTAELEGATSNAGGTATYNFYHSANCTGTPVAAPQVTVTNGVIPPSPVFQPPFVGEWSIQVVYSGNNTNFPATSECGTENFTLDPATDLIFRTVVRANGQVVPDDGQIRFLPASVTDTLIILGLPEAITGDVTFELFKSTDCSGVPVYSETLEDVSFNPTSLTFTSSPVNLTTADWGTYNWVVTASGDVDGDGIPETATSECGEETFTGVTQNPKNVDIRCTYNATTQLTSFRVLVSKPTTADPDIDPNLTVVATPTDNLLNPLAPITYHAYDSSNPASGVNFISQPWRQLSVQITWPDGTRGSAVANCNTTKLNPDLTTGMVLAGNPATPIEQGGLVVLGSSVYDTTQLVAGTGTVVRSGTLTYTLYRSEDCAAGTAVFGPQNFTTSTPTSTFPNSGTFVVDQTGTYNWVVSYSGDANNNPASSACGEETFVVEPLDVTVLTSVVRDDTGAAVPDGGIVPIDTSIHDTATLDGAYENVSGEVTYTLYNTADCSGEAVFTDTVTIANGAVPPSSSVTVDNVGTYNWVVSYSGDGNHNPATSTCGDETVLVEEATPGIVTDLSVDEASAGDTVFDTATITGASANVTGTVTFFVYTTDDCTGDPLYTLGPVTVENGQTVSPTQVFDTPGHYEWQAIYSGDANNEPATSACGTEPLDIVAPDVVLEKSAGSLLVTAGDDATFTITVSNIGQGNAYDVVVTDTLPADIEWTIDPEVEGCAITGSVLNCIFDTLAPGASVAITLVGTTDAADCGLVTNLASVTADNEPDSATGNNSDAASLRVNCPDIVVRKTTDTPVISATDTGRFTIEVQNVELGEARDVTLTDTLPAGTTWTIDPANPDCEIAGDGITLTCDIGTLGPGETFSVTVTALAPAVPGVCAIFPNEATADSSNEPDDALDNNTNGTEIQVLCPEMSVIKTSSTGIVSAGDDVRYTITAINGGEGNAYDVVLTDELPAGIEWTIDPAVTGCAITGTDPQVLTCDFDTMAPGATIPITVVGTTDAADCGVLNNQASVEASNEPEGERFTRLSRVAGIEVLCPDILVEKTAGDDVISAGDDASFTISVTNTGEGIATNVTVEDELPAGIEWTIDPPVDGCEITSGTLECTFPTLGPLETIDITVVGTTDAADCGILTNTAEGGADNEPDDATDNNSASSDITVNCSDILVEKDRTGTPLVISAGDDITFTITVSNLGPGDAYDVTVEDVLPAGVEWTIDPPVEGCGITAGTLECAFDTLPAGESIDITVTGTTDAADCGILTNTATGAAGNEAEDAGDNNSDTARVVVLCPDVVVEKTTSTADVSAGDDVSFTITVSNDGLGDAYDVVVTDVLPAGVEWTIDPAVEDCGITAGTLECEFNTLPAGESIDITVTGTTDAADCGTLENLASADASNEPEDATDNNEATADIIVNCPDILVEKTTDTPVVSSGDDVRFTITVSNPGEGNAYDVVLNDLLPSGIDWSENPDNPDCTIAANGVVLTCNIGTLAPGAEFSVTVEGTTDAANCGILFNMASAGGSNEPDGDQFPNTDNAEITVNCPDIVVEKTTDTPVVSAGDEVSYTITVTNDGDGNAYDVILEDELPAGIAWTIDPPVEGCAITGTVDLTCDIGTMESGDDFSVTVTGTTDAADCGILTNVANGEASNESGADEGNNSSTAEVTVNCPDIVVEKSTGTVLISAGDEASFTITVTNDGEGRADGVTLTDTLPAGIEWTIEPANPDCTITDNVLTCDIGTLEPGESFSVTVVGTTAPENCAPVLNVARADAENEADEDTGNNTDGSIVVIRCPDIVVEKTTDTPVVSAGDEVSFTITVSNDGAGDAYDVVVTDELPAGIEWTIDPPVEGCAITDSVLTCEFDTIPAGESIDITVTGTTDAADCGVLTNIASADASNEQEEDTGNNESEASIEVLCPDLVVEKSAAASPISAGDEASFTITISNIGEGTAYDVVVTDELPAGVEWTIDPAVEGCAIADGTLTCEFAELPAGSSIDVTVTGTTDAADCGILLNQATGEASNETPEVPVSQAMRSLRGEPVPDDILANNTADASIEVLCPDIVVEKTAADTDLTAGDVVSFTITVTNTGEGNAYDVVVTDELPAGFNWDVTGDYADDCAVAGGTLACTIPVLAPGEAADIVVTAPTTTSNCGTIENAASADASNEPDDATGNNDASSDDVTIVCPPPVTPDGDGTPISVLPDTGSGGPDAGTLIPLWGQVAAAMLMLAAAVAVGTGSVRNRRQA